MGKQKAARDALIRMIEAGQLSNVDLNRMGISECTIKHGNHSLTLRWFSDDLFGPSPLECIFDGSKSALGSGYVKTIVKAVLRKVEGEFDKKCEAIIEGCPND